MNHLQEQLQQIGADFVSQILELMGQATLADLREPASKAQPARRALGPTRNVREVKTPVARPEAPKPQAGKRHRATAEEVQRYKDLAMKTSKQMPAGFSKGDLMRRTGGKVDMGRFLGLLVDEGLLVRKGERRNARYWVK